MRGSRNWYVDEGIPEDVANTFYSLGSTITFRLLKLGVAPAWIIGKTTLKWRPLGEIANGATNLKTKTIDIYYPQRPHVPTDLAWVIVHEIAHRIWNKGVSKRDKAAWALVLKSVSAKMDRTAVEAAVRRASAGSHSPLWFYYQKNYGNDLNGFADYLSHIDYAAAVLPRDYATTSPEEAWADVVAEIVLGRSHNGKTMRKSTSLLRDHALQILGKGKLLTYSVDKFRLTR